MRPTIWLTLLLAGCEPRDSEPECVPHISWADADGDGFGDSQAEHSTCELPDGAVLNDGDCDDGNGAVFPDADEVCNGADDDCDGDVDHGAKDAAHWYPDEDEDGFGASTGVVTACDAPTGYTSSRTDCDDTESAVHPGAEETWYDGLDQDCDGESDYDADGDGHNAEPWGGDCDDGDAAVSPSAIEIWYDGFDQNCDGADDYDRDADGWAYDAECDDLHADAHPGLAEVCGDLLDNDCDATANDCRRTGTVVGVDADGYIEGGGASFNLAVPAAAGDQSGDGVDDFFVLAYDAKTTSNLYYGVAYLFEGGSRYGAGVSATSAGVWLEGTTVNALDRIVANGDVNGDGQRDVLVSSLDYDDVGGLFVVKGPVTATRTVAGNLIRGTEYGDAASTSAAFVPDWNGDGRDEVLVGAPGDDTSYENGGATWVFEGSITGTLDRGDADFSVAGEGGLGCSGDGGDFDGDGVGDIALGERYYSPSPELNQAGRVVVFAGPDAGLVTSDDAPVSWSGVYAQYVGRAVANVGDVDADGISDLAFSSYAGTTIDTDGRVYLMSGGTLTSDLSSATAVIEGEDGTSEDAGADLGSIDFDADGFADLLVAAPGHDGNTGAAYLFYGPLSGTLDVTAAEVIVYGEAAPGYSSIVAGLGDIDGDGYGDFGVGAPNEDVGGIDGQGAVWLLYGTGM